MYGIYTIKIINNLFVNSYISQEVRYKSCLKTDKCKERILRIKINIKRRKNLTKLLKTNVSNV